MNAVRTDAVRLKSACRLLLLVWFLAAGCAQATSDESAGTPSSSDGIAEREPTSATGTETDSDGTAANIDVPEPDRPGEDWPQFLGPRGDNTSTETGLVERWSDEGPPVVWQMRTGNGYTAPSIRGNRLVLFHRIGDEEVVDCLRADTGERLWRYSYPSHFSDPYGYSNGPRATPLLTVTRCYTFGAEGKLTCLDLKTGRRIWMRDTNADWNVPRYFFGFGCTPILEGDRLIVLVGGQPNSGVVAFDAETGKTLWENVGKDTWDGAETGWPERPRYSWTGTEMLVSYSSPIAATIHGKRHVLCLMRQGLVSLDPRDGSLNFNYWFRSRAHESVNAARPVVVGDQILLSAAYRVGSALLKVHKDGRGYDVVWRNPRNLLTHWSTAIPIDGYVYGFSARHEADATLRCVELATGRVMWQATGLEPVRDRLVFDPITGRYRDRPTGRLVEPFYGRGSAILADSRLIVLNEHGMLALIKPNPERCEEICRTYLPQLRDPTWPAPVLSRKRLYLRGRNELLCLDLAPNASSPRPDGEE